jgi:hypothetical protein
MAKSFFASLKNELVYRAAFPTRNHAHRAIARYIEVFYIGDGCTPGSAIALRKRLISSSLNHYKQRENSQSNVRIQRGGPNYKTSAPAMTPTSSTSVALNNIKTIETVGSLGDFDIVNKHRRRERR